MSKRKKRPVSLPIIGMGGNIEIHMVEIADPYEPGRKFRGSIERSFSEFGLRSLLSFDSETGEFTWTNRASPRVAGKVAGTAYRGNRVIVVNGSRLMAHRIAWLFTHGYWPVRCIDHINGNPLDNRPINLREATNAQNSQNCKVRADNNSGHPGIHWDAQKNKWCAQITVNGRTKTLGRFSDKSEAIDAYKSAKGQLHTFHPKPVLRGAH